jgi:hypothetical protein
LGSAACNATASNPINESSYVGKLKLATYDLYIEWSFDSQSNGSALDAKNRDRNVIANLNLFSTLPC